MQYAKKMLLSSAVEALLFVVLVFGVAVIIPELGNDTVRFSWPKIIGGLGVGGGLWFGAALLFSRPTTWGIPVTDRDWLDQQIGYLRLRPTAKRQLGSEGQAFDAPATFHSLAELWIRPADQPGQLRIDGPRQLIRKLQTRYAKRAATSS